MDFIIWLNTIKANIPQIISFLGRGFFYKYYKYSDTNQLINDEPDFYMDGMEIKITQKICDFSKHMVDNNYFYVNNIEFGICEMIIKNFSEIQKKNIAYCLININNDVVNEIKKSLSLQWSEIE